MKNKNSIEVRQSILQKNSFGVIHFLPAIIGFLIFTLIPVSMSLYYSLTEYDGITKPIFVG